MSYNKSLFEGVPKKNANKSRFNLSHEWKSQLLPGFLVPFLCMETLPNDDWSIDTEFMFRFEPLYFPIMHKFTMRADYFFIPNRILWVDKDSTNSGWAKWIALQNEQTHPFVDAEMKYSTDSPGTNLQVLGFMGVPLIEDYVTPGNTTIIPNLNAFPLSAYLKIWDEYYRIPQLEDERWFPLEPGNNDSAFQQAFNPGGVTRYYPVLSAKWEKDYFTSALPEPQIGEAVQIPMITDEGFPLDATIIRQKSDGAPVDNNVTQTSPSGELLAGSAGVPAYVDQTAVAATIKQLRLAEVLQSYYERIMKVGQRYRDYIKGLWEDDPLPGYVDVPIMIGSKFGRVQVADVMTTADTTGTDGDPDNGVFTGSYRGQMNLYERADDTIQYSCREHGWIIGILQVNANTSYGQGIERFWRREVQTDYPLDMFANIGDQEILKEEVLWNSWTADVSKNKETFGYIPRFSEMRYKNNVHTMQLNFAGGLSMTAGRYWAPDTVKGILYDQLIEINDIFVRSEPYTTGTGHRLIDIWHTLPAAGLSASTTQAVMFAHIFHSVYVNRQLPMFSTPKLG